MAANLAVYWGIKEVWQIIIFYCVTPVLIFTINLVGVDTFGWIEAFGGILKIALVLAVTIILYVIAGQEGNWSSQGPINDGFQYNPAFTSNKYRAICYVIPMVAFGFLGIEAVAVTAFEARDSKSLRLPSQSIAYTTLVLYFLCLLGQCLNVSWTSDRLPLIYSGIGDGDGVTNATTLQWPLSSSLTIIALWDWGKKGLAGFINGAMIFSVLSASNTSLYVASRTLYGLAREVPTTTWLGKLLHGFAVVVPKTGVPAGALFFSAIAFIWLPFMHLQAGYAVQYLVEIIQISASVSILIVWATLSVAYLRYYLWLKKCRQCLVGEYEQFLRNGNKYEPYTVLAFMQPIPAIVAIAGCLVILGFCSATWWDLKATFSKVAIGYAAPIVLFTIFVIFKIVNRRLWIRTNGDFAELSKTLGRLKWYKQDEREMKDKRQDEGTRVLSPPLIGSDSMVEEYPMSNFAPSTEMLAQRQV
ncbi:hypothetical protein P153DRAFT_309538 [Dothidotthia symphoricarpi CBS 119687]|uniref:Amino acid permease/ SLC12A domain-containing protein n=1 Tax=Dothidotthia symphoricarpi CBS 119687 TaxID=1392245 RepID=A0A6A6APM6_9PLEO|nr:uncharacterized protein P153DRAFT_309538 [Dothidotthia symphoricarpi CBS 119687]KAF2132837.1 hypothetical protein P153DRAFT_309538 [Dothidotthia symphoricarpi CBS 119687]